MLLNIFDYSTFGGPTKITLKIRKAFNNYIKTIKLVV